MFHLTGDNFRKLQALENGAVFTYSEGLDLKQVRRLAKKIGRTIVYCKPGSDEYKQHGSFTCKVYYKKRNPQRPIVQMEEMGGRMKECLLENPDEWDLWIAYYLDIAYDEGRMKAKNIISEVIQEIECENWGLLSAMLIAALKEIRHKI